MLYMGLGNNDGDHESISKVELTDNERLAAKGLFYFLRYTIPGLLFFRNIAFVFLGIFFIFGPIYIAYLNILEYQAAQADPSMYFPLEDLQLTLGVLTCMGLPLIIIGIKMVPIALRSAFKAYFGGKDLADDIIEIIDRDK